MSKITEHFLSIPADFGSIEIRHKYYPARPFKIHAVSALHGTRLHLTSRAAFTVRIKGKQRDSRERQVTVPNFPRLRTGDLPK